MERSHKSEGDRKLLGGRNTKGQLWIPLPIPTPTSTQLAFCNLVHQLNSLALEARGGRLGWEKACQSTPESFLVILKIHTGIKKKKSH